MTSQEARRLSEWDRDLQIRSVETHSYTSSKMIHQPVWQLD
ncbi:hypothetical protein [Pirellula sp. SH-Sr6A]|nr:hypothetical protein [Pirellula sp. SH-Sr6A]